MLAVALFQKEFTWFVHNDDNRVVQGKELREDFLEETGAECSQEWLEQGCSMLEMLIALSRRCAFEADDTAVEWFWIMIDNVGLRPYVDEEFSDVYNIDVDVILERVINRTYDYNGHGGLFPLRNADRDQRKVELWYQMASYLMENNAN